MVYKNLKPVDMDKIYAEHGNSVAAFRVVGNGYCYQCRQSTTKTYLVGKKTLAWICDKCFAQLPARRELARQNAERLRKWKKVRYGG